MRILGGVLAAALAFAEPAPRPAYPWNPSYDPASSISRRISPPEGFERGPEASGGFGSWLRGLPLRDGRPPVRLFDGRLKGRQDAHAAVVNLDVGRKDLQQCADAVMRLRAEYLYSRGKEAAIKFNMSDGKPLVFSAWAKGDNSYARLRAYLERVFNYAGSHSLSRELKRVTSPSEIEIGDVFIKGGFPGHAVIVVDAARRGDGRKVFLLAQSYMPAQEVHLLKNPADPALSPWYSADFTGELETPEWTFTADQLKRF